MPRYNFKNHNYYRVVNDNNYNTLEDSDINQYGFNEEHYNKLRQQGNYAQAAKYAMEFHLNDPVEDKKRQEILQDEFMQGLDYQNRVRNMNNDSNNTVKNTRFGKATKQQMVEAYDVMSENGSLAQLAENGNPMAKEISNYLNEKGNFNGEKAVYEQISFQKEKRRAFGIKGTGSDFLDNLFDGLARDNKNTLANFVDKMAKQLNISKDEVYRQYVTVDNQDGSGTFLIRKDDDNYLAFNVVQGQLNNTGYDANSTVTFFNNNGQEIKNTTVGPHHIPQMISNYFTTISPVGATIRDFRRVLTRMSHIKNKYFNKLDEEVKQGSTFYGEALTDTDKDKKLTNALTQILDQGGWDHHDIYWNNKSDKNKAKDRTDHTLREATVEDREKLYSLARLAFDKDPENIILKPMCDEFGNEGISLSFSSVTSKEVLMNQFPGYNETDDVKDIEIFIHGMDLFGRTIDKNNTYVQAHRIARILKDTNGEFDLNDNVKVKYNNVTNAYDEYDNDGNIIKTGLTDIEIKRDINVELGLQEGLNQLIYNCVNNDGKLADKEKYLRYARSIAANIMQESDDTYVQALNPEKNLIDELLENLSSTHPNSAYFSQFNAAQQNKLSIFYKIYSEFLNQLNYIN